LNARLPTPRPKAPEIGGTVRDAFGAHGKTPHMKALGGKLKDRTDKGGGVVFYELLE
jgi:hypothetical protein